MRMDGSTRGAGKGWWWRWREATFAVPDVRYYRPSYILTRGMRCERDVDFGAYGSRRLNDWAHTHLLRSLLLFLHLKQQPVSDRLETGGSRKQQRRRPGANSKTGCGSGGGVGGSVRSCVCTAGSEGQGRVGQRQRGYDVQFDFPILPSATSVLRLIVGVRVVLWRKWVG